MPKTYTLLVVGFSGLYRRTRRGKGTTGQVVRLSLKPITPKKLRVLTHVTAENLDSDYTKIRLGIADGAQDHYIDELQGVAANELAVSRSDILLWEGDSFFVEFTGTVDDDSLVLTVMGWDQNL